MAKIVIMNNGAAFSCLTVKGEDRDGKKVFGDAIRVNAKSAVQVDKPTADYILELYPERCSIASVVEPEEKPEESKKRK